MQWPNWLPRSLHNIIQLPSLFKRIVKEDFRTAIHHLVCKCSPLGKRTDNSRCRNLFARQLAKQHSSIRFLCDLKLSL